MANEIIVKGASENNLKHIDVTIPRDKLVVPHGTLSGSGKSLWHLIQFTPRDSGAMWKVCPLMQDSFWDRWINRMWK